MDPHHLMIYEVPQQDCKKKLKDLHIGTGHIAPLTRVPSSELPSFGKVCKLICILKT